MSADGACDLVIFDCDGVLVDSERIAIRVDAAILEEVGWPLSEAEIVERFVGRPHAYMVAEIEAQVGRHLGASWADEFAPRYEQAFIEDLVAVDGIVDVLDLIARDHSTVPICVASSSKHRSIRRSLDLTALRRHFAEDRIFSTQDVANGKPAPDVFLHAAAAMGADPARCTVIEDSAHGVAAGRAAGMRVLAYTGGVTPAGRLAGRGPSSSTTCGCSRTSSGSGPNGGRPLRLLRVRMVPSRRLVSTRRARASSPMARSCAGRLVGSTLDGWWDDVLRALNH